MRRSHDEAVVVITNAPESSDDEYDRRRKKYAIMMSIRIACVIAAGTTYQISVPLALICVAGGAVLPWCAVLIANDRPVKRHVAEVGFYGATPDLALPAGSEDRTVDG